MTTEIAGRLTQALSDRYRVERELGAGGMATVYLAHDLKHERDVALKVLHPELAAVLGAERFLAEIKVTAKLQHPHILPLLDSGEADGLLFYVMPVVDGESLRGRLQRETQLPVDDALRITREVGAALDYAHRHGVIHRDIKPENILVHDNSALVTDFGIALAVTAAGGARLTQTGLSLGTPQYMAPEQAMGEKAVDARADVYALGCVLYEMLAGQAPFTGPTAQAIVAQVLTTDALPVTTHRKTVPPNVARAVHAALQKLPADRFGSIAEFTGALDGSVVMPAAYSGPAAPAANRSRTWGVVAASLAIGAVIGVGVMSSRSSEAASREPRYFQIALPETAQFYAGANRFDAVLKSVAITRDGRSLVYVASTPSGIRLALARLDRGTVSVLRGTDSAYLPAFSPDGRSIAFMSGTKLQRISVEDGTITTLGAVTYPFALEWGGDGRIIAQLAADSGCLHAVTEAGGTPTVLISRGCSQSSLSPIDARGSAFVSNGLGPGMRVVDLQSDTVAGILAADGSLSVGSAPMMLGSSTLLFFRDSSMLAARIDVGARRLVSAPVGIMTNVRREAWLGATHAALADDGTLVWAAGGDASVGNLVWVNEAGRVTDTALTTNANVTSYALSPDANRIAYSTRDGPTLSGLLIADLRRRVTDFVPLPPSVSVLLPANWIRNGRAFTVRAIMADGRLTAMLVDLSGPAATVDTASQYKDESRDMRLRCFDGAFDGTAMEIENAGSPGRRVVVDPKGGDWCRFSPDGSQMVYVGGDGLYVARTSGRVAESRVKVAPAGADEGRWSEDGKTIYYRDANKWFAVSAPTSDMRPGGESRLLFSGRFLQAHVSWERSRDGRYLMLQGAPTVRLRTLNVMTNFPALVEQKLKAAK